MDPIAGVAQRNQFHRQLVTSRHEPNVACATNIEGLSRFMAWTGANKKRNGQECNGHPSTK